ncbi:MAG TPA: hypothetical protein VL576_01380 [Candidatus Paceibacterota bacterium]|jgi:hypothetical protein|nr:hypothetical protein [Candidatus Paceibacterota bacterium]
MNTKKLFQNLIYVVAGSIVAIGLSYVAHAAGTWNDASGTPPANNTAFPLNVGAADQIKQGGLGVTTFIANANAELDGSTYFTGPLHADPANGNSTISIGGTDPKGITRNVNVAMNGSFTNSGSITSAPLANNAMTPVCANSAGVVILCSASTNVCSNIPGSTTVPAGDVKNADGTCSIGPKRFYSISGDTKAEYFTNGTVVNGNQTYHVSVPKGEVMSLVGIIGIDNAFPFGWVVDDIKTINSTVLDNSGQNTIMKVTEKGSYDMKISSQGLVGIKGKFSGDQNWLGADFYMKVHTGGADQWIHLVSTPPISGPEAIPHEAYPVTGKTTSDFGLWADENENTTINFPGMIWGGAADKYSYIPYNFNFEKTMNLAPGDTVNVYAFIYGISRTGDLLHSSPNNFTYSIESTNTVYDFLEIPS